MGIAEKGAEPPAPRMGKHLRLSTRGRGALRRCSAFFNDRGRAQAARAAKSSTVSHLPSTPLLYPPRMTGNDPFG